MTSLSKSSLSGSASRKVAQPGSSSATQGRHELAASGNGLPDQRVREVDPKAPIGSPLDQAVKNASHYARKAGRRLKFTIEQKLNRTIVTVRDDQTNEIVRQIPIEEMMALAELLADVQGPGEDAYLKGLFFDQDT